mgnify:CR=1 FL=1
MVLLTSVYIGVNRPQQVMPHLSQQGDRAMYEVLAVECSNSLLLNDGRVIY